MGVVLVLAIAVIVVASVCVWKAFTRACCSCGSRSCSGRPSHRTCAVHPGCCRWSDRPLVRLDFPLDLHGRRPQCLHGEFAYVHNGEFRFEATSCWVMCAHVLNKLRLCVIKHLTSQNLRNVIQ